MTAHSVFGLGIPLWAVGGSIILVTMLSVGLWIARDASARGSDQPWIWALVCVTTPVGLPYYFYLRFFGDGINSDRSPVTGRDRWIRVFGIAGLVALLVGSAVAPPDPVTQIRYVAGTYVAVSALAALVVLGRSGRGKRPESEV